MAALNAFQFYMQVAQQWQKNGQTRWLLGPEPTRHPEHEARKKEVATALAIEAMTVQVGATNRKKNRRLASRCVCNSRRVVSSRRVGAL